MSTTQDERSDFGATKVFTRARPDFEHVAKVTRRGHLFEVQASSTGYALSVEDLASGRTRVHVAEDRWALFQLLVRCGAGLLFARQCIAFLSTWKATGTARGEEGDPA